MDKLINKQTKNPPTFKRSTIELMIWAVVFRVSHFATIATMMITGIISLPFTVLGFVGQIRVAMDMAKSWKTYSQKQRQVGAGLLMYCFVSMLAGMIHVGMFFFGNTCLMNCSGSENQINTILLLIFLFL